MSTQDKHEKIRQFFEVPFPEVSIKHLAVGLGAVVLGIFFAIHWNPGFGLFVAAFGGVMGCILPITPQRVETNDAKFASHRTYGLPGYFFTRLRFDQRPTFQQMKEWRWQGIQKVIGDSWGRLGLEQDSTNRDPIYLVGPMFSNDVPGIASEHVCRRWLEDKKHFFYSTYKVAVFHFTEDKLCVYRAIYNMIKDVSVAEQSDHIYYRHIVALQTTVNCSNYTLKGGEKLEHSKSFTLSAAGGQSINIVINDPKINVGQELESQAEYAIANIRKMLDEHNRSQ